MHCDEDTNLFCNPMEPIRNYRHLFKTRRTRVSSRLLSTTESVARQTKEVKRWLTTVKWIKSFNLSEWPPCVLHCSNNLESEGGRTRGSSLRKLMEEAHRVWLDKLKRLISENWCPCTSEWSHCIQRGLRRHFVKQTPFFVLLAAFSRESCISPDARMHLDFQSKSPRHKLQFIRLS